MKRRDSFDSEANHKMNEAYESIMNKANPERKLTIQEQFCIETAHDKDIQQKYKDLYVWQGKVCGNSWFLHNQKLEGTLRKKVKSIKIF